jgi:polar amino acid transport system substrate-binding protein
MVRMEMEKKLLAILLALVVTASAVALSGCTEEEAEAIKIIIGTSADFPPFEYIDDDGTIIGFDIELLTSILEGFNYTVEVKDIAFDSLIPSLQAGTIDVIAAAMTITAEREEQIDFSDPYYEADQSILALTATNLTVTTDEEAMNLTITIGAQTGTTGAAWVQDNIPNATLNQYDLYVDAVLDLNNGNIDAILLDQPVAAAFAEDGDKEVVYVIETGENYGFGVEEGNTELLNQINQGLDDYIDSADWTNLITKYFE